MLSVTRVNFKVCNEKSGNETIPASCAEDSCEWAQVLKPYLDANSGSATAIQTRDYIGANKHWLGKYISATDK